MSFSTASKLTIPFLLTMIVTVIGLVIFLSLVALLLLGGSL